jgi:hypothetical protein
MKIWYVEKGKRVVLKGEKNVQKNHIGYRDSGCGDGRFEPHRPGARR